jgi:hypothetical protein
MGQQRAVDAGQPLPVHVRRLVGLGLMPAHQNDGITCAGIRHRDARIRRHANGRGNSRYDLERHLLLVEEQRLFSAAVEHERIAPLQPDDDLSLARLFDQQQGNRILVERARRSRPDVDPFRVGARRAQQPRVDLVVVDHDVGRLEMPQATDRNEAWVSGTRADEVDTWVRHAPLS